jgi:hypothetical protein
LKNNSNPVHVFAFDDEIIAIATFEDFVLRHLEFWVINNIEDRVQCLFYVALPRG